MEFIEVFKIISLKWFVLALTQMNKNSSCLFKKIIIINFNWTIRSFRLFKEMCNPHGVYYVVSFIGFVDFT